MSAGGEGMDDEAEDHAHEERQPFNCPQKGAAKKKRNIRPG